MSAPRFAPLPKNREANPHPDGRRYCLYPRATPVAPGRRTQGGRRMSQFAGADCHGTAATATGAVGSPKAGARGRGLSRNGRKHTPNACTNCRALHLSCDVARPCPRCVAAGKADSCVTACRKNGRPGARPRRDRGGEQAKGGGGDVGRSKRRASERSGVRSSPTTPVPSGRGSPSEDTPPAEREPPTPSLPVGQTATTIPTQARRDQLGPAVLGRGIGSAEGSACAPPALYAQTPLFIHLAYAQQSQQVYIAAGGCLQIPPSSLFPASLVPAPLAAQSYDVIGETPSGAERLVGSTEASLPGLVCAAQHHPEKRLSLPQQIFAYTPMSNQSHSASQAYPYYSVQAPLELCAASAVHTIQCPGESHLGTSDVRSVQTSAPPSGGGRFPRLRFAPGPAAGAHLPETSDETGSRRFSQVPAERTDSAAVSSKRTTAGVRASPINFKRSRPISFAAGGKAAGHVQPVTGGADPENVSTSPEDDGAGAGGISRDRNGSLACLLEAIEVCERWGNSWDITFSARDGGERRRLRPSRSGVGEEKIS